MLLVREFSWKNRRNVVLIRGLHYKMTADMRNMKNRVLLKAFSCLLLASVALCFAGCQQKEEAPAQQPTNATTSTNASAPAKAPEHPEHPK
jgi:hypothetical protein